MESDDRLQKCSASGGAFIPSAAVKPLTAAVRQRHPGAAAVLFYGSCLRSGRVDDGVADFYLLVDDYSKAYGSRRTALMNRLLPPNVFHLKVFYRGKTLRAKYAVLSLQDFEKGAFRWFHSYIWGRFAQPSALIWARSEKDVRRVENALALAVHTLIRRSLPQVSEIFSIRELWVRGLGLCYRCELRAEKPDTANGLFDAAPNYYKAVTHGALKSCGLAVEYLSAAGDARYRLRLAPWQRRANRWEWRLRQVQGKGLSVLRLTKGLLTFDGGVDYLLWKIERHSGVRIEISRALRRFPALAVCVTFWRLFRKGAVR